MLRVSRASNPHGLAQISRRTRNGTLIPRFRLDNLRLDLLVQRDLVYRHGQPFEYPTLTVDGLHREGDLQR